MNLLNKIESLFTKKKKAFKKTGITLYRQSDGSYGVNEKKEINWALNK